jgi:phage-related tail fiber protein
MANLPEQAQWEDGIYQLETSDPVLAGPDGIDNRQATQLGNRTAYLKAAVELLKVELAVRDKKPVRVVTTGAITLSGLQTVDGIALVAGDRVLVNKQVNGAQNWIYIAAAGSWSRAPDADEDAECTPGHLILVQSGTVGSGSIWQLSNTTQPQVGTTALTFVQVFGKIGITAGTYRSLTVDAQGRVTAGSNPTTLDGYGLTAPVYDLIRSQMAAFGLGSAHTPTVGAAADLPTLLSGNYYFDNPAAAAVGYPGVMFAKRLTFGTNRGFELANAPYGRRTFIRYSNGDGSWATPEELAFLKSPIFTGIPEVPTAGAGTNTQQVASCAFVRAEIAALVNGAPGTLDQINELAAAIGNDPNFAVTISAQISTRAAKATTLGGYGIVDAYTKTQTDALIAAAVANGLFAKEYVSSPMAFPVGVVYTLGHNFGMRARLVTYTLKCISDEWGYVAGDEIDISALLTYPGNNGADGFQTKMQGLNEIVVKVGAGQILITDAGSTVTRVLTRTKWNVIVRAYA